MPPLPEYRSRQSPQPSHLVYPTFFFKQERQERTPQTVWSRLVHLGPSTDWCCHVLGSKSTILGRSGVSPLTKFVSFPATKTDCTRNSLSPDSMEIKNYRKYLSRSFQRDFFTLLMEENASENEAFMRPKIFHTDDSSPF